jgi:DNA-3-methyladenine glycosylase
MEIRGATIRGCVAVGAGAMYSGTKSFSARSRLAGSILPVRFYDRPTEKVALELLGAIVYHRSGQAEKAGRIVEVEAYLGHQDPACHIGRGLTPRTRGIFGRPGTAYVFVVYGIHLCLNAITMKNPPYGCVLIRAIEPWDSRKQRPIESPSVVPSGPGLVSKYLRITAAHNGTSLTSGPVLTLDLGFEPKEIGCTPRIGVSGWEDRLLRYYDVDSEYVSAM